jgi:DNA-binding MarR family transcriptional regulator
MKVDPNDLRIINIMMTEESRRLLEKNAQSIKCSLKEFVGAALSIACLAMEEAPDLVKSSIEAKRLCDRLTKESDSACHNHNTISS